MVRPRLRKIPGAPGLQHFALFPLITLFILPLFRTTATIERLMAWLLQPSEQYPGNPSGWSA
jgi:hypothetical protein